MTARAHPMPLVLSTLTLLDINGNAVSSVRVNGGTYKVVNGKVVFTPDCWFLGRVDAVKCQVQTQSGIKLTAYVQGSVGWC
ncbi:MAG: hypothetical protein U0Q10_08920 [Dermatophilaceae bacterium]